MVVNHAAISAITPTLYADFRAVADRLFTSERQGHTLQPTAVVNEACIRLLSNGLPALPREQQLALAARVFRQVLVDHARARDAQKRGGGKLLLDVDGLDLAQPGTFIDLAAVHEALARLHALSERQAEVVSLRIYSGMTSDQIALVLDVSTRTVEGDWAVARAWLRRELVRLGALERP
jgi:RNA polymerase sigma factor (TIGR02999 family)